MTIKCQTINCKNIPDTGDHYCRACHEEFLLDSYNEYFDHVDSIGRIPLCFDSWLKAGRLEH